MQRKTGARIFCRDGRQNQKLNRIDRHEEKFRYVYRSQQKNKKLTKEPKRLIYLIILITY